jgi:hypothetical protein
MQDSGRQNNSSRYGAAFLEAVCGTGGGIKSGSSETFAVAARQARGPEELYDDLGDRRPVGGAGVCRHANTMQTWTARQHASQEVWVPPPSLRDDRSGGYMRTKRPHYGMPGDSDMQDDKAKN